MCSVRYIIGTRPTCCELECLIYIWILTYFHCGANSVVESVGKQVEEVREGDLVVPVFQPNCGECRDCKSTKSDCCSKFILKDYHSMPREGTSRFRGKNGEVLHHFLFVSSFSEYTVVDVAHVVKITREIPVNRACLLSCGVSTFFSLLDVFYTQHFVML